LLFIANSGSFDGIPDPVFEIALSGGKIDRFGNPLNPFPPSSAIDRN
jgi:hypothetical protein